MMHASTKIASQYSLFAFLDLMRAANCLLLSCPSFMGDNFALSLPAGLGPKLAQGKGKG